MQVGAAGGGAAESRRAMCERVSLGTPGTWIRPSGGSMAALTGHGPVPSPFPCAWGWDSLFLRHLLGLAPVVPGHQQHHGHQEAEQEPCDDAHHHHRGRHQVHLLPGGFLGVCGARPLSEVDAQLSAPPSPSAQLLAQFPVSAQDLSAWCLPRTSTVT